MADTVLIVDDDEAVLTMLYKVIRSNGIEADTVASGEEALERTAQRTYDLILLDVNLMGMDGFQVVQTLRQRGVRTPIIIVSGRKEDYDTLYGLDIGADDYVTKPFGMGELMARMRVCLRRAGNKEGEPILTCGGLQLNLLEHRVVVEGREVKLTPTEYELLKVMLKYAGRVLTHKQLLKAVWGNEYDTDTHYIRIYMRQLRRKIEPDPAQPKYLITEAGIGYRLLGGE